MDDRESPRQYQERHTFRKGEIHAGMSARSKTKKSRVWLEATFSANRR